MRKAQLIAGQISLAFSSFIILFAALMCAMHPAVALADDAPENTGNLAPGALTPDEPEQPAIEAISLYRLYNGFSGEHFYTTSEKEKDHLAEIGWFYEGVGWQAPKTSNAPVYRLYNPNAGDHHYTISAEERDKLIKVGWNDEGIGWYSDDAKTIPVYRQYNPHAKTGTHNFTYSQTENDNLVKVGWRAEGTSWHACGPGESDSLSWFSRTHLYALASCIGSSSAVTPGYNTTIDDAKLNRLKKLVATDVPIAFVGINARTGKSVACNADMRFYGASTIKAPYIAALCKYDAPNINSWIGTMEDIIRWSSNEGFNSLVAAYGTFYESAFARESTFQIRYPYEGAYVDLTPRELVKLWITIRSFIISADKNSGLFRSLFDHDYYKEGWMYDGDLGGQVYHVGGISGDMVYAIMTRYQYEDSEVWAIKDAMAAAIR